MCLFDFQDDTNATHGTFENKIPPSQGWAKYWVWNKHISCSLQILGRKTRPVLFFRKINKNYTRHLNLAFSILHHWTKVWGQIEMRQQFERSGRKTDIRRKSNRALQGMFDQPHVKTWPQCLKTPPERPRAAMCVLTSSSQASHLQLREQTLLSPLVHPGSPAPPGTSLP